MVACRSLQSAKGNKTEGWRCTCQLLYNWSASYKDACGILTNMSTGIAMSDQISNVIVSPLETLC